jgi:hypothetical protein
MTAPTASPSPKAARPAHAGQVDATSHAVADRPAQRADRCRFPFGKPAARLTGAR